MLNKASLAKSVVGRAVMLFGALNLFDLNFPPIIRIEIVCEVCNIDE